MPLLVILTVINAQLDTREVFMFDASYQLRNIAPSEIVEFGATIADDTLPLYRQVYNEDGSSTLRLNTLKLTIKQIELIDGHLCVTCFVGK